MCASAGNLGQALAWSGRGRGLDVTVVASRYAPAVKLDRIRALGARLELVDGDIEQARERAAAVARHHGIRLVEDSLDIETCEGAATIGLELAEAAGSFDAVLIALGGGALATGVGHVMKDRAPGAEVICVQPLGAPAMTYSWRQRRVVTTESASTIADGVAGRRPIRAVLDDLLLVADDAVLVQEASIVAGLRMLLHHAGLVVEPSAALGIAAILEDRERFAGRHVVTIVCGSNVDPDAYHRWTARLPTAVTACTGRPARRGSHRRPKQLMASSGLPSSRRTRSRPRTSQTCRRPRLRRSRILRRKGQSGLR